MRKILGFLMAPPDKQGSVLSNNTLVPIGLVISLIVGVVWITNELNSINNKLERMEERLLDQWTKRDMENWTLKLKLQNQSMDVPTVK